MDDQFIIVTRSVLVPGSLTINVFELGWILQKIFSLFSNFGDYFFCKILYTCYMQTDAFFRNVFVVITFDC